MTGTEKCLRAFMELAPTAREEGCIQKFYLYLMPKPSNQLVITYAAMNGQEKAAILPV